MVSTGSRINSEIDVNKPHFDLMAIGFYSGGEAEKA